jgi:WD40 repeat protein
MARLSENIGDGTALALESLAVAGRSTCEILTPCRRSLRSEPACPIKAGPAKHCRPAGLLRLLFYALLFSLPLVFPRGIMAGEAPKEPVLRVETGMHTALIQRIAIDSRERFLVTASFDKTLRVWDLRTGENLSVIRPPIGPGDEGKLFAVAMTPDGETIACGGWTQFNGASAYASDEGYSIYIFDRASGRMIRSIPGMRSVINHLSYSADGRFLAASLGSGGIRVWSTADYSLTGQDTDYGQLSISVNFDPKDRIVSSCYDGFVRLYAPPEEANGGTLRLIAKMKLPGGTQPYCTVFSPDGGKVAVAFLDTTKVDVVSGDDLHVLYEPNSTGMDNGDLCAVSFSADGSLLYAGGTYDKDGQSPIRRWTQAGQGPYVDLQASPETIMEILPLKDGGVVYGAGDPAFGVFDAAGNRILFKKNVVGDFRACGQGFMISRDGLRVRFGYEVWGASPAVFSVESRELDLSGAAGDLLPPRVSAPGLDIKGWQDTTSPTLNGRALALEQYETARCLAIAPDGNSFFLGSEWYVRRYDNQGSEVWEVPVPGIAWAVNISGDGRLAVAAFGDGTIRWYDYENGKELLAFFPHGDRKRWVLWSPSGYYDCSPGGEDLIGWNVNNGKDKAADFFSASRFRDTFYRPDVVGRMLIVRNEPDALSQADAEAGRKRQETDVSRLLPPVVTIVSPVDGATVSIKDLTVSVSIRTPSGEPVTAVRAFVDGRPVNQERGVKVVPNASQDGSTREINVTIPERDCVITVMAENRFAVSEPAAVRVHWAGPAQEPQFTAKPVLYVLAVGVSEYADKSMNLKYPAKDAKDLAQAFAAQKGLLYRDVITKVLTDETATKDDVLDGLEWLQTQTTSRDVAVLFVAGHGLNDEAGIFYFLPENTDLARLKRTGLPFSDIKNTVSSIAGKVVCFIDTCHSGNIMGGRRGLTDINAFVNELASAENGVVVFASSTGRQYSLESDDWGNGAFTKAVVEGIKGGAAFQGDRITINMMDLYISERVKALTNGQQTPTTTKPTTVPDFPLAVKQ